MKKILFTLIKILFVAVIFFLIGRIFYNNWALIKEYRWDLNYTYLLISFPLLITAFLFAALGWHLVLIALDVKLPLYKTIRFWFLSQLGRFLPGYIWSFFGRIAFIAQEGVSKKRGLLSTYLEAATSVLAATLTALVSLLLSTNRFEGVSIPLIAVAIIGCIIFLHPKVLEIALNTLFTILRRDKVKVTFSFRKIFTATASFVACWLIMSLAFFLLVKSIYNVDTAVFFDLTFAFTASWVIGFLTIFSPAGLGVREGVLILLLSQTLPGFIAPVISIAARLWSITGELITLAMVLTVHKRINDKDNK